MEVLINKIMLSLVLGDITKQTTDAIVNSANKSLLGGSGVDGAIHRAGGPKILDECMQIFAAQGGIDTGEAAITTGGNLPSKWVIHTVGPIWYGGVVNEAELLASAYTESLKLAEKHGLRSISFPSISTGVYHYPLEQAAEIALSTVIAFIKEEAASIKEVVFVLFDAGTYEAYLKVLQRIK